MGVGQVIQQLPSTGTGASQASVGQVDDMSLHSTDPSYSERELLIIHRTLDGDTMYTCHIT